MQNDEDSATPTGPQGPYKPIVPAGDNMEAPISEGASDEPDDSLLQSASNGVGEEVGVPPPAEFKPKKKKGKKVLLFLIVLLLIGASAAAYYYLVYKKPAPAPATETPTETPAANTFTPENVAYAFREKTSEPYMTYVRPVAGGDRVETGKLSKDYYPNTDVYGQNVVILSGNKLQVSTDGGKTYTQILETEAGQEITSAAFNTDGTKLGIAILDTEKSQNTVSSMELDGQDMATIFTSKDHQGIHLMGWNDQSVVFDTFIPNSDGSAPTPYHYSIESKKSTKLIKSTDGTQTIHAAVSDDLTKLVYSAGQVATAADDPFALPLAPHTISIVDVATGESKEVAKVGKADEKAPNGTPLQRDTLVGFAVNSTTPYYTDAGKLFTVSGDESTLLYETKKTLVDVLFASDDTIIASSGTSGNFALTNFNTESKTTTNILEGDTETILFGVTTK